MRHSNRLFRLVALLTLGGLGLGVCVVALAPGLEKIAASAQYSGKIGPQLRALEDPTTFYDANGAVYERIGQLDRQPVSIAAVPRVVRQAIIATEDRTFYTNDGIDVRSAVRALASNVGAGGIAQGGSTITQQLIKNRFFKNPKRNLDRKVREAILAHRLTNEWSKNRILEEYLNTVYFGQNSYGIQAASTRIIGKPDLAQINLPEAALLAGMIKNPTDYDIFDPAKQKGALERRNEVIRRMRVQHVITEPQALAARSSPLPAPPRPDNELRARTPYGEEVLSQLKTLPELGKDPFQREQTIFSGGFRVYTEFDPRMSEVARSTIASVLPSASFAPFTAAIAVMDPKSGAVRAVVGGGDTGGQAQGFNLATDGAGRQVGSTFKPLTLATAIANGYSPNDLVDGSEDTSEGCVVSYPKLTTAKVHNAGGAGTDTLLQQTKHSVNCAYLRLFASVGPEKVIAYAKQLGLTRKIDLVLNSGIGDTEHTPLEMVTAYSTIADEGVRRGPVFVRRIEDAAGRVVYRAPSPVRVLSAEQARTVTSVLSHVTDSDATGPRAKLSDRPIAGKTGTTTASKDAWFAGYTPQLAAVVWMGDRGEESTPGHPGRPIREMKGVGTFGTIFGGTYPAIIWQKFMSEILKGQPVLEFTAPDESLWPKPAMVNQKGGRGAALDFSGLNTSTTSSTLPVGSTSTSSSTSSSSSSTSTSSTTTPKPPPP